MIQMKGKGLEAPRSGADAAGAAPHPPVHGVRLYLLVGVLLIAQILDGMDLNALAFVGSSVTKDLALTRSAFGACVGAGFLGLAVGAALFGAIADRMGRRRTLLAVVSIFGIGSLLTSQVTNVAELFSIRLITGMALGGLVPISAAILLGNVAPSARTTAIAIVVAGSAGGAVLAGLITSFVVPTHGWRALFVIGGLAPIAILPLLLMTVPADQPLRSAVGKVMLHGAPGGPSLFREGAWRLTLRSWAGMVLGAIPVFVSMGWLPSLIEAEGASPGQAAFSASLFSVGGAIGGIIAGGLSDRFGFKIILPIALAGAAAVSVLGTVIGGPVTAPVASAAGFFTIGLLTLMGSVVGQFYPDAIRGMAVGFGLGVQRTGAALAPWGAGKLFDLGVEISLVFLLCGAASIASGLVFTSATRLRRTETGSQAAGIEKP